MIGAILAGMTVSHAGSQVPSLAGLQTALLVAAAVAGLAAVLALLIPIARPVEPAAVEEAALADLRPRTAP